MYRLPTISGVERCVVNFPTRSELARKLKPTSSHFEWTRVRSGTYVGSDVDDDDYTLILHKGNFILMMVFALSVCVITALTGKIVSLGQNIL